jgi:hypothetical protein
MVIIDGTFNNVTCQVPIIGLKFQNEKNLVIISNTDKR